MKNMKQGVIIVGKVVTLGAILFLILAVLKMDINFTDIRNKNAFIAIVIIGSAFICLSEFILAHAWYCLLKFFSRQNFQFKEAAIVYAKANIGKYLPGNVMHYVERNLFATKLGLRQKDIVLATFIEVIGIACVSILLSLFFAADQLSNSVLELVDKNVLLVAFIGVLLVFVVFVFLGIKNKSYIIDVFRTYCTARVILKIILIVLSYMAFLCIGAITLLSIFLCLQNTTIITSVAMSKIPIIFAAYIIAWVLGFIVPGAPGGIGVREFVLFFLLSNIFDKEIILSAIMWHRLVTIVGDLAAYIVAVLLEKKGI